jgi:2-polyprenyl-3-methyl-5-hydroxy-6-metoxy-1,4-benzoquinol methylase
MSQRLRTCPLLEHPSTTVRLRAAPAPWDLRRCEETGFVYLANPPAQHLFQDAFAWEATHEREAALRSEREPVVHAVSGWVKRFRRRVLRRDKMTALVASVLQDVARRAPQDPLRLVDVGCGEGMLAHRVVEQLPEGVAARIEPIGIEISNVLAQRSSRALRRHGGRCIHATGIDGLAEVESDSVHAIVLSCILEHEIEPLPLLRRCVSRLAADGRVVVKVPNYACLARHVRGSRWCGYRWPDHVNYFTPKTLVAMGQAAGLRVVRMTLADRQPLSDSLYAVFGRASQVHANAA